MIHSWPFLNIMAKQKNKSSHSSSKPKESNKRIVDLEFEELNSLSQNKTFRTILAVFIPLFFFGIMTMVWMIPFPEIAILKKHGYHIFLNWGSFFIAFIVYAYLKYSPMLSYVSLVGIGVMSFFIVQLEYWEKAGGPPVYLVGLLIALISFIIIFWGSKLERKPVKPLQMFKFLTLGPIWLLHFVFNKMKINF